MGFYDEEKSVRQYIEMADGFDGAALVAILSKELIPGSRVLELGMGPGKDIQLLSKDFTVTGSDRSPVFIDLYREAHPDADLLLLDAVTLETDRTFDCVYSNKVLHHLSDDELAESFRNQARALNPGGLIMHSFWYGSGEEFHGDMRAVSRDEENVMGFLAPRFDVMEMARYKEFEDGDSLSVLARVKAD